MYFAIGLLMAVLQSVHQSIGARQQIFSGTLHWSVRRPFVIRIQCIKISHIRSGSAQVVRQKLSSPDASSQGLHREPGLSTF